MNALIKQMAEEAGFDPIQHGEHIVYDISTKENIRQFANLIVKKTINEMVMRMFAYNIDQSNNPAFYKVIAETEKIFGVADE